MPLPSAHTNTTYRDTNSRVDGQLEAFKISGLIDRRCKRCRMAAKKSLDHESDEVYRSGRYGGQLQTLRLDFRMRQASEAIQEGIIVIVERVELERSRLLDRG